MTVLKPGGLNWPPRNTASQKGSSRYVVLAVASVVALLYWPATTETLGKWQTSNTYSHGFLLAPISTRFASAVPADGRPFASKLQLSIIVLMVVFGAIWFGGYLANVKIAQMLALPALIWCGLSLVYGWEVARGFVVATGLLFFCGLVWDYGNFVLQDLAIYKARQCWVR